MFCPDSRKQDVKKPYNISKQFGSLEQNDRSQLDEQN